jgi:hypothetical protein
MADAPLTPEQIAMQEAWGDLATWAEHCPHCRVVATPRQAPGGRTVVQVTHQHGCPEAE